MFKQRDVGSWKTKSCSHFQFRLQWHLRSIKRDYEALGTGHVTRQGLLSIGRYVGVFNVRVLRLPVTSYATTSVCT